MLQVNGVRLYHEVSGEGPPLVLVHGSWVDHTDWDQVADALSASHMVIRYDRRGHSRSERQVAAGDVDADAADLAGVIASLAGTPAHIAGNSFGAIVALRLALSRPQVVASLSLHEPPLIDLLDQAPAFAQMLPMMRAMLVSIAEQIVAEDAAGACRRFVDEVALGPGAWDALPGEAKERFILNAPTFVDETQDPTAYRTDPDRLSHLRLPVQLSTGDQSPPFFAPILDVLGTSLPHAERVTYRGAGHIPHQTHPHDFVATLSEFIARARG